jgi:hypothetical protein
MRACRAHRETCEACTVQVRGRSNKPSSYYEGLVDVMEELYKFTFMTRDRADYLVDRYSERKAEAARHSVRNASNRLYTEHDREALWIRPFPPGGSEWVFRIG